MAMKRTVLLLPSPPWRLRVRSIGGCSVWGVPAAPAAAQPGEDEYNAMYGAGWDAGAAQVRVGVWWDFENCSVPFGMEAHRVGINIVSGLRSSGFKGPVNISGYGDMLQLSRTVQESLTATGIRLHHVPSGGRESESSDRALLMDLMLWTIDNPPPAHLFLISGDRDFSTALHKLRMRNYNVLLACPAGSMISQALLGAASRVWYWNSLVRGEGLVAATSWSSAGPPPRPIIPPLKSPPTSQPSKVEQDMTGLRTNQEKVPYFTSQLSTSVQETANLKTNQEKILSSTPASYPPIPPPFSSSPPIPPVSTSSPSSTPAKASYTSPYSVSSPLFPSVCTALPPSPRVSSKTEHCQVATSKIEPPFTKTNSGATKSVNPNLDNKRNAVHDKSNKTESIQDVLGRLDSLLKAHPQGLWMSELQAHMVSGKIQFDNDFFGHKKLVPYLLTLPRIARVERHLMRDNKTWSYMFFSSSAPPSDMKSSKRAGYPRDIVCQLGDLFRHHPKGLWLGDFNAQLVARSIRLDSNFYGHVKLVPFLLTLPELAKIERRYVGDRWNYMFIWNQLQSLKLENCAEKPQPVVRRLDKSGDTQVRCSNIVPEPEETSVQQKAQGTDPPPRRLSEESANSSAVGEPENALVKLEKQVTVFSRIVAASESIFEMFKTIYQRLWPKEESEHSLSPIKQLDVNREAQCNSASEGCELMITSVDNSETGKISVAGLGAERITEEQEKRSGAVQQAERKALKRRPLKRNSRLRADTGSEVTGIRKGGDNVAETSQAFDGAFTRCQDFVGADELKSLDPGTKVEETATKEETEKEQGKTEETSIDADRILKLFECIKSSTTDSKDHPASIVEETLPFKSLASSTSEHEIESARNEPIVKAVEDLKVLIANESPPCSTERRKRPYKKKAATQIDNADKVEAAPLKTRRKSKSHESKSVHLEERVPKPAPKESLETEIPVRVSQVEAAGSVGTVTPRTSSKQKKREPAVKTLVSSKTNKKTGSLALKETPDQVEISAKSPARRPCKKTRKTDEGIGSCNLTNEKSVEMCGSALLSTSEESTCHDGNKPNAGGKRKPSLKKKSSSNDSILQ